MWGGGNSRPVNARISDKRNVLKNLFWAVKPDKKVQKKQKNVLPNELRYGMIVFVEAPWSSG